MSTAPRNLGPATALTCRECGESYDLGPYYACEQCFGPLEVTYDYSVVSRERIEAGPRNIWRYRDLLPVPSNVIGTPNTEPGFTRLVRADNLAEALGVRTLWVKDDSGNPTHSFKDRVVAVALAAARELGFKVLACPSTGNLANAVAAAAARAGIRSAVFVPSDLEQQKIVTTAVYGGTFVTVDGNYDDVNRLASEIAGEQDDWAFVNVNVRPYYAEGSKTIGYEIAEQLGFELPDRIVAPIASGSLFTKVARGMQEWLDLGLLSGSLPAFSGAQAAGCAPVADAFEAGWDICKPVRPDTIAKSLAIGNPADGPYALELARSSGGGIDSVSDQEIRDGIRLLGETVGIFTETAGGVTTAVLRKLAQRGDLDPGERIVLVITGDGLKTLDAVRGSFAVHEIDPSTEDFERHVPERSAAPSPV